MHNTSPNLFSEFGVRESDCGVGAESGRPQLSKSLIWNPARSPTRWDILIYILTCAYFGFSILPDLK